MAEGAALFGDGREGGRRWKAARLSGQEGNEWRKRYCVLVCSADLPCIMEKMRWFKTRREAPNRCAFSRYFC